MPFSPKPSRTARFGVFELDRGTGELRKNGAKVRLQEQPFQVLAALLERPGELVTDGKLLAYASDRGEGGDLDIWVQQVGDARPTRR